MLLNEYCETFIVFYLDTAGNKQKLVDSNGNSMFVCHAEDELNLDQFETDIDYEENESSVSLDIQNLAVNFIGEHECVFSEVPAGFRSEHLKLMVTTEANAIKQSSTKTEFKAELIVEYGTTDNAQIDDEVYINCPKSGECESFLIYAFNLTNKCQYDYESFFNADAKC